IDGDAADVLRGDQPNVFPGAAGVCGLVNAVAISKVRAEVGLAGADINNVGIGLSHGKSADRGDWLAVKDRLPGNAAVDVLKPTSGNAAEVINVGLPLSAAKGDGASAAVRTDHAPAQSAIKSGV